MLDKVLVTDTALTLFCNDGGRSIGVVKMHASHGGYCAFITHKGYLSAMSDSISSVSGKNSDYRLVGGLLATDWYPVGFGDTVEAAMATLNTRVAKYVLGDDSSYYYAVYDDIVNRIYRYDKEDGLLVLRREFYPENIPNWMRSFNTITDELIDEYLNFIDNKDN